MADPTVYQNITKRADLQSSADIYKGSTQRPFKVQVITVALDTAQGPKAQPYFKIGFPFKSVTVRSATDSATSVNIRIGAADDIQQSFQLLKNDSIYFDYEINEAYLDWSAQASKSVTLLFMVDARLQLGSTQVSLSGGVALQDGTAVAAIASVTLAANTAAAIAPALATRKTCVIQNNTGGILYYGGDATVTADNTATGGIQCPAGGQIIWRNTANLFAISVGGGIVNRFEES